MNNCWMNLHLVFTCCHFNDLEKKLSEVQGKVASSFAKQHNESNPQRLTTLNEIFTWRHSIPSFPAVLLGHSEAGRRRRTSEVGSPHGRPGGSQHFHVHLNLDITKDQGTGKISSLYRGFVISRFSFIYFTVIGVKKIVRYIDNFLI